MFDLTTQWLGIGHRPGRLEAVERLAVAQGIEIVETRSDGSVVQAGEAPLTLAGTAQALHIL